MATTLQEQLVLHRAAGLCDVARFRPWHLEGEPSPPILGADYRGPLLQELAPTLDEVWPGHPEADAIEDLDWFLQEASKRVREAARKLEGEDDFVPAASFEKAAINLTFEHLKIELEAVAGAIAAKSISDAFATVPATAGITEVVDAGIRIKLRAVGSFLVGAPSRYEDEVSADHFYPVGKWAEVRDGKISASVAGFNKQVDKQTAHLTLSRPFPEERWVYRSGGYRSSLNRVLRLLTKFTETAPPELLPNDWAAWLEDLQDRSAPEVEK